ncbi:MAG: tetratricopeptide repeat protein, partial [Caldilineaceae bacterium]|nr:tetratricopeptide repeat protein [Caldilineaceae bacterium]
YYEHVLLTAKKIYDKQSEGKALAALGNAYSALKQAERAIDYHKQALTISREIGDRNGESLYRAYIGHTLCDLLKWQEAAVWYQEALQIADEIQSREAQSEASYGQTLTHLMANELVMAAQSSTIAKNHEFIPNSANVLVLQGVIQLRLDQPTAAQESFTMAIAHANGLLGQTPELYAALDTVGLAQAGLALCGASNPVFVKNRVAEHVTTAIESYSAARAITSAPGIVRRVLRLFDALAVVDTEGVLTDVRAAAAGEEAV